MLSILLACEENDVIAGIFFLSSSVLLSLFDIEYWVQTLWKCECFINRISIDSHRRQNFIIKL